jgi:hypothetical protein
MQLHQLARQLEVSPLSPDRDELLVRTRRGTRRTRATITHPALAE